MGRKKGKGKGKGHAKPKSMPRRTPSGPPLSQLRAHEAASKHTLVEEARWMSKHRSTAFDSGKKLRHLRIEFVSAGYLEGTIKEKMPPVEPPPASPPSPRLPASVSPVNSDAMAQMTLRSPSPSSSEDEIVFKGRGQARPRLAPTAATATDKSASPTPDENSPPHNTSIDTPQFTAASSDGHEPAPLPTETAISIPNPPLVEAERDSDTDSVVQDHFAQRRGGKAAWEGQITPWVSRSKPGIGWLPDAARPDMDEFLSGEVDPRDAAMDDYMQNLDDFGLKEELVAAAGFARREMDLDAGSHNDWNEDTLRDLDGLSTSSDVIDTIEQILSKRSRKNGVQYLIVYEGSTPDDARWLPASFLKSAAEQELIRDFEAELLSRGRAVISTDDSSDSEADDADTDDDDDDTEGEDDDDFEMDDEKIARILQKQEELGLGSDDIVLYSNSDFFGGHISTVTSSGGLGKPNKSRQHRARNAHFPSASAMADALDMDPYNGFDIMDTERPSLRRQKKGRRGQMPPELDDSDLNEQLQTSWEADRANKRLRKAEREELRKQGLLGRKDRAPDLSVRYRDGVNLMEIVEEIREFMMSGMQTLSLPPMEAHRRATIHQFVGHLGLSSKSRGDGATRFTVLSKTLRTKRYDDDAFDSLVENKRFRLRARGTTRFTAQKQKGQRVQSKVSYKDGDTVGASAPELGPENRGHAMLKKMGWSKGMALGALDNKGILQPIPHTVKTTKAGLQ